MGSQNRFGCRSFGSVLAYLDVVACVSLERIWTTWLVLMGFVAGIWIGMAAGVTLATLFLIGRASRAVTEIFLQNLRAMQEILEAALQSGPKDKDNKIMSVIEELKVYTE